MSIEHTDKQDRQFRFTRAGDTWRVEQRDPAGSDYLELGTMPITRDWKNEVIDAPLHLYRAGAGHRLYQITLLDELTLEHDMLEYLEITKRSPRRIEKSRKRLDWLHTIEAAGHVYMDSEWEQGITP